MKKRSILIAVAGLAILSCCCCGMTQTLTQHRRCDAVIPVDDRFPPRNGEEIEYPFPLGDKQTMLHIYPLDPNREEVTFHVEDNAGLIEPVEIVISYDTWAGGAIRICQLDEDAEPELVLEGAIHEPFWDSGFLDYEQSTGRFEYREEDALPNTFQMIERIQEVLEAFVFLIAQPVAWFIGRLREFAHHLG